MIRAFVGIALPEDAVRRLELAQAGLPAGRPVPPENFHITLTFLGEHPTPVIEDVHLALDGIRAPSFQLAIDGVGLFGGSKPTSFYAGVKADPGLTHLQEKVTRAARSAGLTIRAGRYTPHVTLARFNQGLRGEDAQEMRDFAASRIGLSIEPFQVEEFLLYRSRLGSKGPSYEEMAAYPLG